MICAVYRSSKRPNTYLFLAKKDDFSVIPNELLKIFGKPELVMLLPEEKLGKIGGVSKEKLLQELTTSHYWLWIKQEEDNLLAQHHAYLSRNSDHE